MNSGDPTGYGTPSKLSMHRVIDPVQSSHQSRVSLPPTSVSELKTSGDITQLSPLSVSQSQVDDIVYSRTLRSFPSVL